MYIYLTSLIISIITLSKSRLIGLFHSKFLRKHKFGYTDPKMYIKFFTILSVVNIVACLLTILLSVYGHYNYLKINEILAIVILIPMMFIALIVGFYIPLLLTPSLFKDKLFFRLFMLIFFPTCLILFKIIMSLSTKTSLP